MKTTVSMTTMTPPPVRETHDAYRVSLLEKLIINFALPSDFVYHSFRAIFQGDRSQTPWERVMGLWDGKVRKYQKLLRVKDENGGRIPPEYKELCFQTPCGKVRFYLASLARVESRKR